MPEKTYEVIREYEGGINPHGPNLVVDCAGTMAIVTDFYGGNPDNRRIQDKVDGVVYYYHLRLREKN